MASEESRWRTVLATAGRGGDGAAVGRLEVHDPVPEAADLTGDVEGGRGVDLVLLAGDGEAVIGDGDGEVLAGLVPGAGKLALRYLDVQAARRALIMLRPSLCAASTLSMFV